MLIVDVFYTKDFVFKKPQTRIKLRLKRIIKLLTFISLTLNKNVSFQTMQMKVL